MRPNQLPWRVLVLGTLTASLAAGSMVCAQDLPGDGSLAVPGAAVESAPKRSWNPFKWSGERRKSVERLIRRADGTWHVDGPEDENIAKARSEFDMAQEHFRKEEYDDAAKLFHRIAKTYKDTPIEEDALFLEAESYFKLEKLPRAQDAYARLMNRFPTTRYLPQAVQRTYDIAFFWLEDSRLNSQGQPAKHNRVTRTVNFLDRTRPMLDTEGRALEAIETIQQYDPLGPLTDDAVMMAGAHTFVNGEFVKAATYYEQVYTDQPKSEHSDRALILGAQAYMRAYLGPNYDGVDLENSERLTKAALSRPSISKEYGARLEQDLRAIRVERARRDFVEGNHYRRMGRYDGARYYFRQCAKNFPDTDWGRRAHEELSKLPPEGTPAPGLFARMGNRIRRTVTGDDRGAVGNVPPSPSEDPALKEPTNRTSEKPSVLPPSSIPQLKTPPRVETPTPLPELQPPTGSERSR